jgi:hypothetical protein
LENAQISEVEERKNQKMIRYIRQSQHHDLLDESLSEIDEDDYTEDDSSKINTNKNSNPENF